MKGTVLSYNFTAAVRGLPAKGWGFIVPDHMAGTRVFFTSDEEVECGQRTKFDITPDVKRHGNAVAMNVKLI